MRVMGIETSCDETAVAIVEAPAAGSAPGGRILANLVYSQLTEHRRFGGVVPEIAARAHLERIDGLIEEALLARRIDAAVHSMKDMPTAQPPGLAITAFLPREDARDVLIAGDAKRIADLKQGAIVGTSALRRRAQLLHRRPDLQIVNLRGNVDTRLAKREAGVVEATLLALAGLKRLGMAHVGTPVPEDEMLPAVGQGAVCIECRAEDASVRAWLAAIDHRPTATCVAAEHAMLVVLDGSCRTPIAGHAILASDGVLHLRGLIVKPDGSELIATERRGTAADAEALGRDAGHELKRRGGPGFLST